MLEFFYCGWQGRQTGLKRWRGGGGGRRGGAFGYLASPVEGILFSDCLPKRVFRAYFSQQNSLLWP